MVLLCDHRYRASSWWIVGLVFEALFFLFMKVKLIYLQSKDPLTESLRATTILSLDARQRHWELMMQAVDANPNQFFEDWFFGIPMQHLTRHDLENFIAWACFEDRAVEHLSLLELHQLDTLVQDALKRTHQVRPPILNRETLASYDSCPSLANTKTFTASRSSSLLDDLSSHSSASPQSSSSSSSLIMDPNQWNCLQKRTTLYNLLQHMLAHQQQHNNHNISSSQQLAHIMNNITKCCRQLDSLETTWSVPQTASQPSDESRPKRFKRPTADPLLGIRIAPLVIHMIACLTIHVSTTLLFCILGFQLFSVDTGDGSHPMNYYYRRASPTNGSVRTTTPPVVFLHGIGVGPIAYLHLIYQIITTKGENGGHDVFLPLIPSVSAFRPWIMPTVCLSPHQVASSMAIMLANHGYARATFMGHSFGTFWMTYMIKYGHLYGVELAGLIFLDPVCFCLYDSWLTQRTVYNQTDPMGGDVSYWIKNDMMVRWSIQRNFSWVQGNLFVQDIPNNVPVAVFLCGNDKIAPSHIQEEYLSRHRNCHVQSLSDYYDAQQKQSTVKDINNKPTNNNDDAKTTTSTTKTKTKFVSSKIHDFSVMVFRGYDHGLWLLDPFATIPPIVDAVESFCHTVSRD